MNKKQTITFLIILGSVLVFWGIIYFLIGPKLFLIMFAIIGLLTVSLIMTYIIQALYIAVTQKKIK
jgi:hypothetical protein